MDIEALISSVFANKPLWDQKDTQHHNRFVLDKLWDVVAGEMKSKRNIVRAKWKALRDTFRKELKKIPPTKSEDGASPLIVQSSWKYFDNLYFLKDQFGPRISTGNLSNVELDDGVDEKNDSQLHDANRQDIMDVDQSSSMSRATIREETGEHSKGLKRKQQNDGDVGTALIKLEENNLRILRTQHIKSFDEDESFFDSLLPHIRTLTPQNKMLLRMKMQELVYNFVYGNQQLNTRVDIARASEAQNISHIYQRNPPQLKLLQTATRDYSSPTSVASHLSHGSDESPPHM